MVFGVGIMASSVGGCQRGRPSAQPVSALSATASPTAEPSLYQIPAWEEICAAARTTSNTRRRVMKIATRPIIVVVGLLMSLLAASALAASVQSPEASITVVAHDSIGIY